MFRSWHRLWTQLPDRDVGYRDELTVGACGPIIEHLAAWCCRVNSVDGMTWTRVCFTDRQVAVGDCYRLQRKFTRLYSDVAQTAGMAMFQTAFLTGQQCALYFSPAVVARCPSFVTDVGAQPCERPEESVALLIGEIDARSLLAS
jgi:hypothetical protein